MSVGSRVIACSTWDSCSFNCSWPDVGLASPHRSARLRPAVRAGRGYLRDLASSKPHRGSKHGSRAPQVTTPGRNRKDFATFRPHADRNQRTDRSAASTTSVPNAKPLISDCVVETCLSCLVNGGISLMRLRAPRSPQPVPDAWADKFHAHRC